eukprot:TRINITY_DN23684_c0_g2_i1.p1 TRINITY_DN23684_c0_g2~~TRINITY_DN23684_c0_g2_i1.p1  ORF type:complete len:910 (+),score=102.38 TRINITY_DN23684_c0_g2_i1:52-2730(+)
MRALLLAAYGGIGLVLSHPGTWEGKIIMNENGAPLPDLSGHWSDGSSSSEERRWTLQLYQPPEAVAVAPNSTYAVRASPDAPHIATCTLAAVYDYETRKRLRTSISCEGVGGLQSRDASSVPSQGQVLNGDRVSWHDGRTWSRSPLAPGENPMARYSKIHKVHVIFMNHYDVGYTDFLNGVDNTYMHKYYPLAEKTSEEMRNHSENFIYITHPWLMERFLSCPCPSEPCLATSLNNTFEKPLQCPSPQEVADFTAAVKRGDIAWNGAPFNIQPENMSPELFRAGLDLTRRMDARFGRPATRTMSIRDVIYVSRAVLPLLRSQGITGLTIGSNGADFPPQVPKLHRWLDRTTGADIVVAYHPYGYGGFGLKDCAESPNGVALCTEFRSDNTGPPSSIQEVQKTLDTVRNEYPGATVISSTFDAFMQEVMPAKAQLPTVDLEVADTWTYGTPSDPLKIAQNRALQRAWIRCMKRGEPRCQPTDPAIQNMSFFLMKAPEHTWGTPGISGWGGGSEYNVTNFRKYLTNKTYMRAAASWAEQRVFNELAVRALEEKEHPLASEARREVSVLENVEAPNLSTLTEVPLDSIVSFSRPNGARVGFRADGALTTLTARGVEWASPVAPLAAFVYQTFNDSEWKPFTYAYMNDHQMQAGFCKPGSNNFSESALWRPSLKRLLIEGNVHAAEAVTAVMDMPQKAWSTYGAPREVYLTVKPDGLGGIDLQFTTIGKLPTMIGEATMVTFTPAQELAATKEGSAWRLDKLGMEIDPENVIDGGNQFTHGVWRGAKVQTAAGSMFIETLDAANMNPITVAFPIGNPLPASYKESDARAGKGLSRLRAGSVKGMAVNLHNNLWNTNYPLFYPYFDARFCSSPLDCRNSNTLYRFNLAFPDPSVMFV